MNRVNRFFSLMLHSDARIKYIICGIGGPIFNIAPNLGSFGQMGYYIMNGETICILNVKSWEQKEQKEEKEEICTLLMLKTYDSYQIQFSLVSERPEEEVILAVYKNLICFSYSASQLEFRIYQCRINEKDIAERKHITITHWIIDNPGLLFHTSSQYALTQNHLYVVQWGCMILIFNIYTGILENRIPLDHPSEDFSCSLVVTDSYIGILHQTLETKPIINVFDLKKWEFIYYWEIDSIVVGFELNDQNHSITILQKNKHIFRRDLHLNVELFSFTVDWDFTEEDMLNPDLFRRSYFYK